MIKLDIPAMSCGHCAGVITNTVRELDPAAVLDFDMAQRAVNIGTSAPLDAVLAALASVDYPASVRTQ